MCLSLVLHSWIPWWYVDPKVVATKWLNFYWPCSLTHQPLRMSCRSNPKNLFFLSRYLGLSAIRAISGCSTAESNRRNRWQLLCRRVGIQSLVSPGDGMDWMGPCLGYCHVMKQLVESCATWDSLSNTHTHSLSRSLCLSLSLTHTQMGEIRDVQRDLDARSDQHRTGILGEDVWLQQQLQRGESTGGRSAACVLQ